MCDGRSPSWPASWPLPLPHACSLRQDPGRSRVRGQDLQCVLCGNMLMLWWPGRPSTCCSRAAAYAVPMPSLPAPDLQTRACIVQGCMSTSTSTSLMWEKSGRQFMSCSPSPPHNPCNPINPPVNQACLGPSLGPGAVLCNHAPFRSSQKLDEGRGLSLSACGPRESQLWKSIFALPGPLSLKKAHKSLCILLPP